MCLLQFHAETEVQQRNGTVCMFRHFGFDTEGRDLSEGEIT